MLITAYGTIERAVGAMRDGAVDYLVKPFDADALISLVHRVGRSTEHADSEADAPVAVDPALARDARARPAASRAPTSPC